MAPLFSSVTLCLCLIGGTISSECAQEIHAPDLDDPQLAAATDTPPHAPADEEPRSLKRLPRQIVQDQKEIWKFPLKMAHGDHWKSTLIAVATTSALVAIDPHDAPYFRKTTGFDDFNKTFS